MRTTALDRRELLLASLGAVFPAVAAPSRLETLTDWVHAGAAARKAGVQDSLERINVADPLIRAWVQVRPEDAMGRGVLSGIPFGVKDIIETRGLSTAYGSPIYEGRVGTSDAAIVADLRRRGGILLGKTQTTAFAFRDPAPTHNPRNLEHTPGGSSSGSAAAVAAGMVPLAVGTQTTGSTIRPASYCGITGFKPSYGLLSVEGVFPYARSFDTLGFFTHTPADMVLLWKALNRPTGHEENFGIGVPEPMITVEPEMATAFTQAVASLRAAGITTRPVDIATLLSRLVTAHHTVSYYEGARFHERRFKEFGDRLGRMADLVREGLQITTAAYQAALADIAASQRHMATLYQQTPVILVPAATGPAPRGLSYTGDASMNAPWSALGTPAMSVPLPVRGALPLGLQVTADRGQDARVLQTAVKLHRLLHQQ